MQKPGAVLLDLGNVVLKLDASRAFLHWAHAAGVTPDTLMSRWALDEAYKRHEVGAIDFAAYAANLTQRFGVELTLADWLAGWNAIFVEPFADVIARLPAVSARYDLCAFTNTNAVHHAEWSQRFGSVLGSFRHIYVSSSIGRRKPDAASYAWVAEDMGHAPEDIVFLDDSPDNVEGALAAGMRAHHVPHVDRVVEQLDALLA